MNTAANYKFSSAFGPWAVVTGASSGIGTEYATQLAARGVNLVLVARNEKRMEEISDSLSTTHGIDTRVVVADLSEHGFLDAITPVTDGLDVGLLVSNAGATAMGALLRVPLEMHDKYHHLNTTTHLALAHHFGERLVARGSGGIIFVGSTVGMQGVPFLANYSSSKAFVHALGQALHFELKDSGVHVSVITPGPTATPGAMERTDIDLTKLTSSFMPVDALVGISLKGLEKNEPIIIPGASNKIQEVIMRRFMRRNTASKMWGSQLAKIAPHELSM
jgi:uncharacterized protein